MYLLSTYNALVDDRLRPPALAPRHARALAIVVVSSSRIHRGGEDRDPYYFHDVYPEHFEVYGYQPVWKSNYGATPLVDLHTGINGEYDIKWTRGQKRQDCTTDGTSTCLDRRHASDGL